MTLIARATFIGDINEESVSASLEQLQQIDEDYPEAPIEFAINSEGGSFLDGVMLYGKLREMSIRGDGKHHLTTMIRGIAASTATLLVQAGDHRVQGPLDLQVWHEPQLHTCGSEPITSLQARIDGARAHAEAFYKMLSERTGVSAGLYRTLETPIDRTILAQEALDLRLIDEIR